jgi:hypothetical protein
MSDMLIKGNLEIKNDNSKKVFHVRRLALNRIEKRMEIGDLTASTGWLCHLRLVP